MTTTSYTVKTAADLSADIAAIDAASNGNGTNYTITVATKPVLPLGVRGVTLDESADIDAINLKSGDTLTIDGVGGTLDGEGLYRGLFVYAVAIPISAKPP
jgi:hypothetical protein